MTNNSSLFRISSRQMPGYFWLLVLCSAAGARLFIQFFPTEYLIYIEPYEIACMKLFCFLFFSLLFLDREIEITADVLKIKRPFNNRSYALKDITKMSVTQSVFQRLFRLKKKRVRLEIEGNQHSVIFSCAPSNQQKLQFFLEMKSDKIKAQIQDQKEAPLQEILSLKIGKKLPPVENELFRFGKQGRTLLILIISLTFILSMVYLKNSGESGMRFFVAIIPFLLCLYLISWLLENSPFGRGLVLTECKIIKSEGFGPKVKKVIPVSSIKNVHLEQRNAFFQLLNAGTLYIETKDEEFTLKGYEHSNQLKAMLDLIIEKNARQ